MWKSDNAFYGLIPFNLDCWKFSSCWQWNVCRICKKSKWLIPNGKQIFHLWSRSYQIQQPCQFMRLVISKYSWNFKIVFIKRMIWNSWIKCFRGYIFEMTYKIWKFDITDLRWLIKLLCVCLRFFTS